MSAGPRVLGLIPARQGSKGIPGKNLRPLRGRPLLAWTAEAALGADRLARVVLTTDGDDIAEAGRTLGLDVPFRRPDALAADDTPMIAVVEHAVTALQEAGDVFDAVCLLQPTSPIRPPGLVDACVDRLFDRAADAVVTVVPIPAEHNPHWAFEADAEGFLRVSTGEAVPITRRQDLPPAVHRSGQVYVSRTEAIAAGTLYGGRLVGVDVDPSTAVNLDEEADWRRAEEALAARRS